MGLAAQLRPMPAPGRRVVQPPQRRRAARALVHHRLRAQLRAQHPPPGLRPASHHRLGRLCLRPAHKGSLRLFLILIIFINPITLRMAAKDMFLIIVRGSKFDLTRIDFSFANYKFVPLTSALIDEYLDFQPGMESAYLTAIRARYTRGHQIHDPHYAILPIDSNQSTWNHAMRCLWLLTIAYPSDLQKMYEIRYVRPSEKMIIETSMTEYDRYENFNPMQIPDDELGELHDFLALAFDRIGNNGYVSQVVDAYLQSRQSTLVYHSYLSLTMALETILDGKDELTYRLKRAVAIILGRTCESSEVLFSMVGYMYNLRSTIIHGERFKREELDYYMPTLERLVSRLIIELIIHNVDTRTTLGQIITRSGFGDYNKISNSHKEFTFNKDTYSLLHIKQYNKYKPQ